MEGGYTHLSVTADTFSVVPLLIAFSIIKRDLLPHFFFKAKIQRLIELPV